MSSAGPFRLQRLSRLHLSGPDHDSAGLVAIGADRGKASLPRFLGIDWGNLDRVGHNDYAIDWAEAEADASYPRRSGMLVAVPAWRLAELLDSEDVQNVKRKEEAEAKKASEGVNLDFQPSEFDEFEALARKIIAVRKKEVDELCKNRSDQWVPNT